MVNQDTGFGQVAACNKKGRYVLTSTCGTNTDCTESVSGVARCYNPGVEWKGIEERSEPTAASSPSLPEATLEPALERRSCQAGDRSCSYNPATRTNWITECRVGYWIW